MPLCKTNRPDDEDDINQTKPNQFTILPSTSPRDIIGRGHDLAKQVPSCGTLTGCCLYLAKCAGPMYYPLPSFDWRRAVWTSAVSMTTLVVLTLQSAWRCANIGATSMALSSWGKSVVLCFATMKNENARLSITYYYYYYMTLWSSHCLAV